MQIRFVQTADLRELESTANLLLVEGWEMHNPIVFLPNGDYFMQFVRYTPRRVYGTEAVSMATISPEPFGGETLR